MSTTGFLAKVKGTLKHAANGVAIGMGTNNTGAITPADWAHIASGGLWTCKPYLDVMNRKLFSMAAGRIRSEGRNVMFLAPPQHGKSSFVSQYFPGWWLGTFPDDRIILTSYDATQAEKWGRFARDAFAEHATRVFPGIGPNGVNPDSTAAGYWEVHGRRGSMKSAGAGGPITGNPANLFLLDDPIKDQAEARSQVDRDDKWEWFLQVAMTRLHRGSCMAMVYTPWHPDDIGQRIIRASLAGTIPPWEIVRIPAISETQEERDDWAENLGLPAGQPDPVGRAPGMPLWPESHPIEKLEMIRANPEANFPAMYQGRPQPKGGDFFKRDWFKGKVVAEAPRDADRVRYWDRAASQGKGDWTVGVLMARSKDGRYFVEHVSRDRLSTANRDRKIRSIAETDADIHGPNTPIRGEQEPGSSGKDAALAFVKLLEGFDVRCAPPVTGDKATRARAFASQAEVGNVYLVNGDWNKAYLDELEAFREDGKSKHDDQVDASSGAFNELSDKFSLWSSEESLAGFRPRIAFAS